MSERLTPDAVEKYWQMALSHGLLQNIRQMDKQPEHRILGRAFEYLGYAFIKEQYREGKFLLTTPSRTWRIRKLLTEDDYRLWQPRIPDGLLFERRGPKQGLKVISVIEYKIAHPGHIDSLQEQFDGFMNLMDLFKHNQAQKGKWILQQVLNQGVPQLEVPQSVTYLYVTPQGRTTEGVASTLGGIDYYKEIPFPASVEDIKRRMQQLPKKPSQPHYPK